jgi:WD40 repeat protein
LSKKTNAHGYSIRSVAFSPDGTKVVSGSDDKTIKVWKLRDQPGERTIVASRFQALKIPFAEAIENAWTPISINGITVTSWGEIFDELGYPLDEVDGEVTIKVWDSGAPSPQNCASFWPKLTPAGLSAGALKLLSTKTKAHRNCVNSVAFSPDGTKIVSGANDGTIKVWDMVKWSRKDHLMFNITTQRFVLRLLWLNKYSMKFPDDVLDLLIEACLQRR